LIARLRERAAASEGMSLVEVLIAVAILGLAIATIAGGIGTAAGASDRHRKRVNADTVIRSFAEALQHRSRLFYQDCATTYTLPPGYAWGYSGYTATVASVRYLQADGSFSGTTAALNACKSGVDRGAQMLGLRVASTDPRDPAETMSIIVRTP
jgi:prepilin-type N-terminal cleavage/methylation domain-containing protein